VTTAAPSRREDADLSPNLRARFLRRYLDRRFPGLWAARVELNRTQWLSPEQIRDLQLDRLRRTVKHAYGAVPYYRRAWSAVGFEPGDLRTLEDLRGLPVLTKQDIRDHLEELTDPALLPAARANNTGGSTGAPLKFYQDARYTALGKAATFRHDEWTGWRFGEPVLRVWGAPRDIATGPRQRLTSALLGEHVVNAFALTEESLQEGLRQILAVKPTMLVGYASALAALADHIRTRGGLPAGHRIQGLVSSAEVLDEDMRGRIEAAFGRTVYNRYGSRETGILASECEAGRMHIAAEHHVLEYLEPGAEMSPLLVTGLTNDVMPLIRYRIEDVGAPWNGACGCGRGLPVLGALMGRTTDFVRASSGALISGPALTLVFKTIPEVRQAQLYQPDAGRLVARIVRSDSYTAVTEETVRRDLAAYVGEGMRISFDYRDELPPEPSGKYRFVVSDLKL
jgi:phenylacetate-CoA ligase